MEHGLSNGQRTLHQMTKPEEVDDVLVEEQQEGEDIDEEREESVYDDARDVVEKDIDGQSNLRSPNGVQGVKARHNFDAVRDGYHGDSNVDVFMED